MTTDKRAAAEQGGATLRRCHPSMPQPPTCQRIRTCKAVKIAFEDKRPCPPLSDGPLHYAVRRARLLPPYPG